MTKNAVKHIKLAFPYMDIINFEYLLIINGLNHLIFLGALSMSFLCSVLEAVLLSTPMSFITMKESQGNKTASLMKDYKDNVDRPVGAILSLNTIAHTIGSAGVGAESIKLLAKNILASSQPCSHCSSWCSLKSSRKPSGLPTGAHLQCRPRKSYGY